METKENKKKVARKKLFKRVSKNTVMDLLYSTPYRCTYRQRGSEMQEYDGCEHNLMMIITSGEAKIKELDVDHPDYDESARTIMLGIDLFTGYTELFLAFEK